MSLKLVFTLLLASTISCSLNEDLINKFFEKKLCKSGTILNCNSKRETIKLFKGLMLSGYRISAFNLENKFSVKRALKKDDNQLAVIVDGDCNNVESVMKKAADLKYFFETYHWLIIGSDYDNIMEKMQYVPLEINVDVTIAISSMNEDNETISKWMFYDIYNPAFRHGGEFKIEDIGMYDVVNKTYNVDLNGIKYYKRRNMTGVLFQSGMVVPEVLSITLDEYLASDKEIYNNTFSRFHSVCVELCQVYYNFTNNRTRVNSWGYQQPNGDVDGLVKALKDRRFDFGNAALMYRIYRAKLVHYGHGNWMVKSTFVFRHPKSTLSSSELYLQPLDNKVWITTLGFIGLLILILKIILTRQTGLVHSTPEEADHADWSFLMLYGIGEMCQQGYTMVPSLVSGKMVTFTVLLFAFLTYQFYSASIVSLLLREPPKTIKTLSDLVKSSLKAGCESALFDIDYLKQTTDPVAIELYNTKINQPHNKSNFYVAAVGLKKVIEGDYAFHSQTSTSYPLIQSTFSEEVICSLSEVKLYPDQYVYMVTPKRSPFIELFNYCLTHQWEVGVLKRLTKLWTARKPFCMNRTRYLKISVGIQESYWGIKLLGFGYILSLIIFILEFVWAKKSEIAKFNIFKKAKNKYK